MTNSNIQFIKNEIDWLSKILELRFSILLNKETKLKSIFEIQASVIEADKSMYAQIIQNFKFGFIERVALILTLAPHINNNVLGGFITINNEYNNMFLEFGGVAGKNYKNFIPTGETLAFIIGHNNFRNNFQVLELFDSSHNFSRNNILYLQNTEDYEPKLSGALTLSTYYFNVLMYDAEIKPDFSSKFPAKLIETNLD